MTNDENSTSFEEELTELLKKYSIGSESNTSDYLLAEYIMLCISNFNIILKIREAWNKDTK